MKNGFLFLALWVAGAGAFGVAAGVTWLFWWLIAHNPGLAIAVAVLLFSGILAATLVYGPGGPGSRL